MHDERGSVAQSLGIISSILSIHKSEMVAVAQMIHTQMYTNEANASALS